MVRIALIGLSAGALFFVGYWIGSSGVPGAPEKTLPKVKARSSAQWEGSREQLGDAVRRWSVKAGVPAEEVLQHWSPRSMFIPTRNQGSGMLCVELQLEPGGAGGSPVYCYKDDTTTLVAEYSNVE